MGWLMTSGDLPSSRTGGTSLPSPLIVELRIAGLQPLSGHASLPGAAAPIPFHGWIDLMSAIGTLYADQATSPPQPSEAAQP